MMIPKQTIVLLLLTAPAAAFVPPQSKFTTNRITTNPNTPFTTSPRPQYTTKQQLQLHLTVPTLDPQISSDLTLYFLQTLISYGVPAVITIVVIGFAASAFSKQRGRDGSNGFSSSSSSSAVDELYSDLYDGRSSSNPFEQFMSAGRRKPKNLGVPSREYIRVTKWNDKLASYDYSLRSAVSSRAAAASDVRERNFYAAVRRLGDLEGGERGELVRLEKSFLKTGGEILEDVERLQKSLVQGVIDKEMRSMGVKVGEFDIEVEGDTVEVNATKTTSKKEDDDDAGWKKMMPSMGGMGSSYNKKMKAAKELNGELQKLELDFVRDIVETLGPERANGVRATMLGNIEGGNGASAGSLLRTLRDRPLSVLFGEEKQGNVFVTNFPGDTSASQVKELREEVTAIVRQAKPGDEALLVLQTGGGTVTGYGLAAAQLQRFKDKGMKLTICVEQVAASGGYMMCCVADRIVASPFAVLGSIGVISDIPNVYERLKNEGIEFQTVTAGKYKRTLTPTKKPTKEDFEKSKKDIEQVLTLFKSYVGSNRPKLDIDAVATGETWFGEDALERKLCDEIKTKDDVLLEYVDQGFDVYEVSYEEPQQFPVRGLGFAGVSERGSGGGGGLISTLVRGLAKEVGSAMGEELDAYTGKDATSRAKERFMARDMSDANGRIRMED